MTRVEELRSLVEPHMSSGHLGILDQLTHVLITGSAQASGGRADPFEFGAALLEHGAPAPPALRCRGWHWR